MSDCCSKSSNISNSSQSSFPKKYTCPVNDRKYGLVSALTIKNHINAPWAWLTKEQGYYFCSDPACAVVYFGQDGEITETGSLRTEVGIKSEFVGALVCYFFGVTMAQAKSSPIAREFVVSQTQRKVCACESRNPIGLVLPGGFFGRILIHLLPRSVCYTASTVLCAIVEVLPWFMKKTIALIVRVGCERLYSVLTMALFQRPV
ncbi:hypothetical protein [Reinekea sp. G2M2-21]|uniref:putative iron-sulfur cluster-binding metallochaperone n=1 Tax=Reinekea sp. G2M2-21 TaxID=2788942 RepID=UPI00351C57F5